jgi:putative glutathione S-transferase
VPVLWDTRTGEIVNNESADILRMLGPAFAGHGDGGLDLYPSDLRASIDGWNARIYETLNNGVYRAGFAKSQAAYEAAFDDVFGMLEALDAHLSTSRYVTGRWLTEADWRLFVTIVRFDAAYHGLFKCNLRPISSYPSLSGWVRELHQWPGIAETVSIDHIKRGYWSIAHLNPSGIVPKGPEIDFTSPHERERLEGHGIRRHEAGIDG